MKQKLLLLFISIIGATFFVACNSGVSSSDVNSLIDGPNSIKGTISGTMANDTAFNIAFDYHVSANSNNVESYSESWIETSGTYAGDSILWLEQYFFFDRNGIADYGDEWSVSGQYLYLEFYMDMHSMKLMPHDYSGGDPYLQGMWQNITPKGNRFVYGQTFNSNTASGTLNITNLKYDNSNQILSGKLAMSLPENHTQNNWYSNKHASTMSADFKIYVPKDAFKITNKSGYYGMTYRKRAH